MKPEPVAEAQVAKANIEKFFGRVPGLMVRDPGGEMTDIEDIESFGELRAHMHIAGYTFERACRVLETLLEGDRWKLGDRFKTVNEFLDSLKLDNLEASTQARKRIAARIKELQPDTSNRAIAKAVGISHQTIGRDVWSTWTMRPQKA
jgi:hypothetical protein